MEHYALRFVFIPLITPKMFTQTGLENLWTETKAGFVVLSDEIEIVFESDEEKCIKIYSHLEHCYIYFYSYRLPLDRENKFSPWIRSKNHKDISSYCSN